MDLSCIISSGDLELYILGMLPEEEANQIAQLAILFPEVQTELDRISESLEGLGTVATAAPSASVKDSLMGKLRAIKEEEQKVIPFGSHISEKKENETLRIEAPVVELTKRGNKTSWLLAASFIGLVFSLGFLIFFISKNKQSQTELASLRQQSDSLRSNVSTQEQEILALNQTLHMEQSNDYRKINLVNVPGKPQALAHVHWNINTKEVYTCDISLPQAPSDKQYQLWAIVDGKPVDAGMLSGVKFLAQKMKIFEKAEMFAITLEKRGGSPTPTMEEMYVAAKV